jgi:hypothetical protein
MCPAYSVTVLPKETRQGGSLTISHAMLFLPPTDKAHP